MFVRIIQFSIRHKLAVGIGTLALVIWGVLSAIRLPIDAVPDITNNQVQVITTSPSLAALEVERSITYPVEQTLSGIPHLVEMRSISRFGLSIVTLVFTDDTDIYWARQQVLERLPNANIRPELGTPGLAPVSTGLSEIYQYTLQPLPGYQFSPAELRTLQDWVVRRGLLGTPGVADVSSMGGYVRQYEVACNPLWLQAMNVSLPELFAALEANNQNAGGAYIDRRPNAWYIRSEGLMATADDIRNTVIHRTPDGTPVLVRDVATVQEGHAVRFGALTHDTNPEAVGGIVLMLKGANSNQVVQAVKARMAQVQQRLPPGIVIVPFLDRTRLVDNAIATVATNLTEGALIVIFVLVLLLGNLRAGLVVASVIPLSLLFAIGMMQLFGVSGNLMSLGAIDFGLIVDGAVIIVEATLHRLHHHYTGQHLTAEQRDREVAFSANRMMRTAAFGQLIILIVYLPILTLEGVEGRMFRPMAETVGFAILGALLLSLTYVPMMSALVLRAPASANPTWADRLMAWVQRLYKPTIHWALNHRRTVAGVSIAGLAAAGLLFTSLGGEFIPRLEEGDFAVEVRLITGSSLSETQRVSTAAAHILKTRFPEVTQVVGKIGAPEIPTDPMPLEACDLMVILKDKHEWTSASSTNELVEQMQAALSDIPGVEFGFLQPIEMRFNELMTGARQDVAVKIFGDNLDSLAAVADAVARQIERIPGATEVYVEPVEGLPQIVVDWQRARLARYGMSVAEGNRTLRMAFAGEPAGVIFEGDRQFDLVVRFDSTSRRSLTDVQGLYLTASDGNTYPITELADVRLINGPNQVQRDWGHRRITVGFNVRGRDVQTVVADVQQAISQHVPMPTGYYPTYGGQFENLVAARARLLVAVPLALALIFGLLYLAFGSLSEALLVFMAIPLAAIGGVLALWLRGMPFSISAGVGFIALFGVAVLNGIVLIAEFNRLRDAGVTRIRDRVLQGTSSRLRPVLMTALVASLGFLPMALSGSSGAEVQRPLATVVIGGLVTATLLTLVVLPALYALFWKDQSDAEPPAQANTHSATILPVLLVLMLVLPALGQAQQVVSPPLQGGVGGGSPLTLAQAESLAVAQNPGLTAARLEQQIRQTLVRTATSLPATQFTWQNGQYNSPLADNALSINQTLPLPTVWASQRRLLQSQVSLAAAEAQLVRLDLLRMVRLTFVQAQHQQAVLTLYHVQDSLVQRFVRAAEVRRRVGESSRLELVTAQAERQRLHARITQLQGEQVGTRAQLAGLLRAPVDSVAPQPGTMVALQLQDVRHPLLAQAQAGISIADATQARARADYLPELHLGYSNQSLRGPLWNGTREQFYTGGDRFSVFSLGLSLPLWWRPLAARTEAARISRQKAEAQYEQTSLQLTAARTQAQAQLTALQRSLASFQADALPQAQLLRTAADLAFRNGSIDYLEFFQSLDRALAIDLEYLTLQFRAQQAAAELLYLSAQ